MKKILPFLMLVLVLSIVYQAFGAPVTAPVADDATVLPVMPQWWAKFQSALILVMFLGRIASGWKAGGFSGAVSSLVMGGDTKSK